MALIAKTSISVVFPAYNEEENIANVVRQTVDFLTRLCEDWEIIIVNDGSHDRTQEIIDGLAERDSRVVAIHHPTNRGYGGALQTGIQNASKEWTFFSDSDLQFHVTEMLLLCVWMDQYDIVIGYRAKRKDPFYRKLNAFGWRMVIYLFFGLKVKDIDCAFKLFHRKVFDVVRIDATGAMVNTDILVQAIQMGFKIKEVPVTHFPRVRGNPTGANWRVIGKAFKECIQLRSKLRQIKFIFSRRDRRNGASKAIPVEQRRGERRVVDLPINFSDHRARFW